MKKLIKILVYLFIIAIIGAKLYESYSSKQLQKEIDSKSPEYWDSLLE